MGIFDIFKGGNKDEKELVVLANDIYTKYQATCDVLSKIKKKNKDDIVKSLETNGVQLDKGNMNLREIHLDIGNAWVFSIIRNEDNSMTDFKKYEFHIMGIRDYQGLNLYFDNGNISFEDLLKSNSKHIYVTETIGHGSNLVTGVYSVGATGFLIENGEFKFPVNEITIAGNFKDMFKNITLASDLDFEYSINSPTMMVEGMTVAGK